MIVCLCHRISDRDIVREAHAGCADFDELQDTLRVGTACGACIDCAQETFQAACSGACASRHGHAACTGPSVVAPPASRHAPLARPVPMAAAA